MYSDYWALIDGNNFYVTCQQVFEPKYVGRPCVVLSNNDGCVVSRSDEAKALGIQMGEPYFLNEKRYKELGVKAWSSNYPLYGDMSQRMNGLIAMECPEVQIYSIDESFAKFAAFDKHTNPDFNFRDYLLKLRYTILKGIGVPVCIGVGPTKALAKAANRVAKKYKSQTGGVHIIADDKLRLKALKWLPVEDVWGIGRRHAQRLHNFGIKTAYDFTQLPDAWVREHMTVVGLRLLHDLQGKPTLDFEDIKPQKNIGVMRGFEKTLYTLEDVGERLSGNVAMAAEKLRKQGSHCCYILVNLSTGGHTENPYHRNIGIKLPYPSGSTLELNRFALGLLRMVYKQGYAYKRSGILLSDFVPATGEQLQLFGGRDVRHDALMRAIDKMNYKYSRKLVKLATEPPLRFTMRQEFLSPQYTTDFKDLLTVRV